jgi:septal ring factor EnvC (AmiA/AmiB activator)
MSELQQEKAREGRMKAALEQFESNADAPMVPGEAVNWLEDVDVSLSTLKDTFVDQVDEGHVAAFRQIRDEDQEMFRRVEQMRSEDREIAGEFDEVRHRLRLLESVTRRVDQDEKRVEAAIAEFVPHAQALVARIRKQEVTVRTWLMEAFNRDRGVAD